MTTIAWKRGATFAANCVYTPPDGALADLLGATITSQIRHNGKLVTDLTPTIAADGLSFDLEDTAGATFPLGACAWDIRIAVGTDVIYTDTVTINVVDHITEPAA